MSENSKYTGEIETSNGNLRDMDGGNMAFRVEAIYRDGHGKNPVLLSVPEDVDRVIDDLLAGPADENLAEMHSLDRSLLPSGFPDHELMVGVQRELGIGVLEFMDASGNWVPVGSSEWRANPIYWMIGRIKEFPPGVEIPLELVRRAAREFLVSGGCRPTCIEWQMAEFW